MEAALGNSKDYSLKQYLKFVDKLQMKAKELSLEVDSFTPSDVERALWSYVVAQCFRVLRRMRLFTFRLRFRAGITGAISVTTKSVRPNRNMPMPATPQPVPSSMARLPPKSRTRA
ncbi:unnamed protein product [Sphenostylis stenocarpa]|uniref:Uncharacterized protein n=1 Tax=Sphenostylis stenocarpa TaxID=92480 RepID=A0AA86SF83_9FABA|nr:unnamed protein product [Sphenostylis stenocarpa]